MKKYIIPALRVADINNETLLAGSDPTTHDEVSSSPVLGNRRDNLFDWTDEED